MSTTIREGDEVVLRLKVGSEAGGFARFLFGAADALEAGHIQPTNPETVCTPERAAAQLRSLAAGIERRSK